MAQSLFMTYPLDQPRLSRPGVMAHEANAPGNAKWLSLPPESAERAYKGDLGLSYVRNFEPRPLTSAGAPFVLKGG